MRQKRLLSAGLLAVTVMSTRASPAWAADASADDDAVPRPMLAIFGGAATSFTSLAIGAATLSRSTTRPAKNAALIGGLSGVTVAPIVAHLIVGEPVRGLAFALIPLVGLGTCITLAATAPDFIAHGPPTVQYSAFSAVAISILGATLGVWDAASIEDRAPPRRVGGRASWLDRLKLSPIVGGAMTGAIASGTL